jgi:hypothetical protein
MSLDLQRQSSGHLAPSAVADNEAAGCHTEKGRDLWPIVTAMINWGDRWAAPEGPPLTIRHLACGQVVEASLCARTVANLWMPAL